MAVFLQGKEFSRYVRRKDESKGWLTGRGIHAMVGRCCVL